MRLEFGEALWCLIRRTFGWLSQVRRSFRTTPVFLRYGSESLVTICVNSDRRFTASPDRGPTFEIQQINAMLNVLLLRLRFEAARYCSRFCYSEPYPTLALQIFFSLRICLIAFHFAARMMDASVE